MVSACFIRLVSRQASRQARPAHNYTIASASRERCVRITETGVGSREFPPDSPSKPLIRAENRAEGGALRSAELAFEVAQGQPQGRGSAVRAIA